MSGWFENLTWFNIAAFGLMLIDIGSKAPKKKLVTIFVICATSVFFANMIRITFLAYVAYAFGYDALETDHMYAGAIIFLSLIGLLWWLSQMDYEKTTREDKSSRFSLVCHL